MVKEYKTINAEQVIEIIEKKSRFIASVKPVESEEEAEEFIESIRKKYKDAGHNVYAYKVGLDREKTKMSDDGEPAKTAGVPILDILKKEEIRNCVVVVTRYFGGTLLGTGGLVRAYSHAGKEGLVKAGIVTKKLYEKLRIRVEYTITGKLKNEILKNENIIEDINYGENVEYIVYSLVDEVSKLESGVIEVSSGRAMIERLGFFYRS